MMSRTSVSISMLVIVAGAASVWSASPGSQPSREALELPAGFFALLPWDPVSGWDGKGGEFAARRIESIDRAGFTLAGFVEPKDLPLCEKLGLKAIVAPPTDAPDPYWGPWRKLSPAQIEERVRGMIEQAGGSPAILGYFITDEPGAPMFSSLAHAVAAVRKHAPGKLAYINLFPSYATIGAPDQSQLGTASFTEYLERFVNEVHPQLLSYDNYAIQHSDDGVHAPLLGSYYRDLLEVRRIAHKHGLPWWNIAASSQIDPAFAPPSPANLLLQAYTTLAAGADGLTWYTYLGSYPVAPLSADDKPTFSHPFLATVNRQVGVLGAILNGLASTGVYFTSPAPAEGLPVLPGRVVQSVESVASPRNPTAARPAIMVGEFTSANGNDFVMLCNLSLQYSTRVRLQTRKSHASLEYVEPEDGRLRPWNPNGQWLTAGQGVLIRLSERGS